MDRVADIVYQRDPQPCGWALDLFSEADCWTGSGVGDDNYSWAADMDPNTEDAYARPPHFNVWVRSGS